MNDGTQGPPLSLGLWLPIHNLPAPLLIGCFMPGLAGPSTEVSLPLAAWFLPDALFPRVMLAHTRWPGPMSRSLLMQLSAAH